MKNKTLGILILVLVMIISINFVYATTAEPKASTASSKKSFGGKISKSTSKDVTEKKSTCESGGTCSGMTSNTWTDMTSTTCGNGTFTLNFKSPKNAASEYCVPSSADGPGGKISVNKLILGLANRPKSTEIGICTCTSGEIVTTETVYANLAEVTYYGVSGASGKSSGGLGGAAAK